MPRSRKHPGPEPSEPGVPSPRAIECETPIEDEPVFLPTLNPRFRWQCNRCAKRFRKHEEIHVPLNRSFRTRHMRYCQDCYNTLASEAAAAATNARLDKHLRRTYGINVQVYGMMHAEQSGLCALCQNPERPARNKAGTRLLVVDHHHESGEVRGLLCRNCNAAIGLLGEDPAVLAAAIIYLTRPRPPLPRPLDDPWVTE